MDLPGQTRLVDDVPRVLRSSYAAFVTLAGQVDDATSWAPTACEGWAVRDLLFHWLGDCRRALVALHTPTAQPPDRDAATYWTDWAPDPVAAANGRRFTRVVASMFLDPAQLVDVVAETAAAVVHASETLPLDRNVETQGHVLRADHLIGTLAVEATIHHLDALGGVPDAQPPSRDGLGYVRVVLDTLLGRAVPVAWSDEHYARAATGRVPLTGDERTALGADADRLPLFS